MTGRRPPEAPAPPHTDRAHAAITCELVRLTLSGRGPQRLELRTDPTGVLLNFARAFNAALAGKRRPWTPS